VPDLSVIIVNYRSWGRLRQCLDSLSSILQNHLFFEVIVVDNASEDGMLPEFKAAFPQFIFLLNSGNYGFANGCNFGAAKAKGEYLLFLNPDTVVNESAFRRMLAQAQVRKDYSVISCRQIRENGSEEKPYGSFLSPLTLTGWLRALKRIYSVDKSKLVSGAGFISPDWVSGSVIMLSSKSFDGLGCWDEDFWMYFEDVDLCRRARNSGGEIILLKDVTIEHNHGGSSRKNLQISALTKCEVNISRHVYIAKHERGLREIYMQTFLVISNLAGGIIPALFGILFIFSKKLKISLITYLSLIKYYVNALRFSTWLSPRSVNYRP
jgi:GT2 family glycosyltransferase